MDERNFFNLDDYDEFFNEFNKNEYKLIMNESDYNDFRNIIKSKKILKVKAPNNDLISYLINIDKSELKNNLIILN